MLLNEIFNDAPSIDIKQLSSDSRMPMDDAIFFCLNGIKYNGHNFIQEAIKNGAKVIVYSEDIKLDTNAIFIKVKSVDEALVYASNIFYDNPNDNMFEYVVSGCYGRTTVISLIDHFLNKYETCGQVSIMGIKYNETSLSTSYQILPALDNLKLIKKFKDEKIVTSIFEANSLSFAYKKLDVLNPDIFIYLNTSKFASDYKQIGKDYYNSILRYLYTLEDNTIVVLNKDDESYNELVESINNCVSFGFDKDSNYRISNCDIKRDGVSFDITYNRKVYHVDNPLQGLVNVYNLTAAIVSINQKGYEIDQIINDLKDVKAIEGVMEKVDEKYQVIVDAAYDLYTIKNVLDYAQNVTLNGRVIGVMAINYSDDNQRIEKLVKMLEESLDVIILTEDESRQSEAMSILVRANKYCTQNKTVLIPYRSVAIENGIEMLNDNDTLLILGKGNEKYLSMGFGKEIYLGDKYYSLKYIKKRRVIENEII